jgi:hypothetical protein
LAPNERAKDTLADDENISLSCVGFFRAVANLALWSSTDARAETAMNRQPLNEIEHARYAIER